MEEQDRGKRPDLWQSRKSQTRQGYYNIATGVTIALLVFLITGACGWVAKMQMTVNKADLALREMERNSKEIEKNSITLHRRISVNHSKLEEIGDMAIRVDERSLINRQDIKELK